MSSRGWCGSTTIPARARTSRHGSLLKTISSQPLTAYSTTGLRANAAKRSRTASFIPWNTPTWKACFRERPGLGCRSFRSLRSRAVCRNISSASSSRPPRSVTAFCSANTPLSSSASSSATSRRFSALPRRRSAGYGPANNFQNLIYVK